MKKTKIVINCINIFDYLGLVIFPIALIFWVLDKFQIVSLTFEGYLLIPLSLILVCVFWCLFHKIEKSNWYIQHEKNYYTNHLYHRNPYKSRYDTSTDEAFFVEFEKTIKNNQLAKGQSDHVDRFYIYKLSNYIKGMGFIEFNRIKDLNDKELECYLLEVLKSSLKLEPQITTFLVCVFCDFIDEESFYRFSKFEGLYCDEIDHIKHEVNFCLLDRSNRNTVFFDYKLYKLNFNNIYLKNVIKKFIVN